MFVTTQFSDQATDAADRLLGPYYRLVLRPLSRALATVLVPYDVSANQATGLAAVAGVGAAVLATLGGGWLIVAALLWQISRIFDLVDGNLARAHGVKRWSGKYFDGLSDVLLDSLFLIGVGFGVGGSWGSGAAVSAWIAIAGAYARMRLLYIQVLAGPVAAGSVPVPPPESPTAYGVARGLLAAVEWFDRNVALPGLVVAALFSFPLAWLAPAVVVRSLLGLATLAGALLVGLRKLHAQRG